jgi:hypothetical protein
VFKAGSTSGVTGRTPSYSWSYDLTRLNGSITKAD